MKLIAWLHRNPGMRKSTMYLAQDSPDGLNKAFTFTEHGLTEVQFKDGEVTPALMEVSEMLPGLTSQFLQAMVDLGAEEGIFPEASHRERIKAESIAEERQKVIDYERERVAVLVDRMTAFSLPLKDNK